MLVPRSKLEIALEAEGTYLLYCEVQAIVGDTLKGKENDYIDQAIEHVHNQVLHLLLHIRGTARYNARYLMATIKGMARDYAANNPQHLTNWRFDNNESGADERLLGEWLVACKTDAERQMLTTLFHMRYSTARVRKRYAELMKSARELVSVIASDAGLSVDDAQQCLRRVANETIPDECIAKTIRTMNEVSR